MTWPPTIMAHLKLTQQQAGTYLTRNLNPIDQAKQECGHLFIQKKECSHLEPELPEPNDERPKNIRPTWPK